MRLTIQRRHASWLAISAVFVTTGACGTPDDPDPASREPVGTAAQAITGNIHPGAIQIDGDPDGADLHAGLGTPLNAGAAVDWVADSEPNSGTGCLGSDAIASCIEPGVTGAAAGVGHWNGVRIVDGLASNDLDIFLSGGKEDDHSTWTIGPGTVGSSKFDITQAYLANNQSTLFFGMERRGNNGTTAFDFEFNQLEPASDPSCPQDPSIPCRSVDDVLFSFEMQGAGKTGSATPYIFTWDGSAFQPSSAEGIIASINTTTTTPAGPWGHVDSKGNWVLGDLARFEFGEAAAPISLLPGVDACGGKAFVQVRTRSSVSATSDLKDTTKIFEFLFNSLSVQAQLTPSCDQGFGYAATGVDADGNPVENAVCSWTFSNGATSNTCSGFINADPGTYTGTVTLSDPDLPGCGEEATTDPVNVYAPVAVTANLTATCTSSFTYDATASGGSNPSADAYAWVFTGGTATPSSSSSKSGSVGVDPVGVPYTGTVTFTDDRGDIQCTATDSDSATPFAPLAVSLTLSGAGATCPAIATDVVSYAPVASGGNGTYAYQWNGAPTCAGTSCTIDPAGAYCHDQSLSVTVSDGSGICPPATSETETYSKVTTITASDN